MSRTQAIQALVAGAAVVDEQVAQGLDVLGTGEMGIGNTTPAAAIAAALTGEDPARLVGPRDRAGRRRGRAQGRGGAARVGGQPARPCRRAGCVEQGRRLRDRRAGGRDAGRGRAPSPGAGGRRDRDVGGDDRGGAGPASAPVSDRGAPLGGAGSRCDAGLAAIDAAARFGAAAGRGDGRGVGDAGVGRGLSHAGRDGDLRRGGRGRAHGGAEEDEETA